MMKFLCSVLATATFVTASWRGEAIKDVAANVDNNLPQAAPYKPPLTRLVVDFQASSNFINFPSEYLAIPEVNISPTVGVQHDLSHSGPFTLFMIHLDPNVTHQGNAYPPGRFTPYDTILHYLVANITFSGNSITSRNTSYKPLTFPAQKSPSNFQQGAYLRLSPPDFRIYNFCLMLFEQPQDFHVPDDFNFTRAGLFKTRQHFNFTRFAAETGLQQPIAANFFSSSKHPGEYIQPLGLPSSPTTTPRPSSGKTPSSASTPVQTLGSSSVASYTGAGARWTGNTLLTLGLALVITVLAFGS